MDMVHSMRLRSDDRPELIVSHVLDQMRLLKQVAERNSGHWRQSMLELEAVQKESELLREELAILRQQAAFLHQQRLAVEDSRLYRLVLRCRAVREFLLPPGSRAERLLLGPFGLAAKPTAAVASDCPAAPPVETSPLPPPKTEPTKASESEAPYAFFGPVPEEIACSPMCWKAPRNATSDSFLNLVILSAKPRSGSTLLQRICNARKGTLIWGEHGGALAYFADIYRNAANFCLLGESQRIEYFDQGENPNLWIANMCPDLDSARRAIIDSARTFLQAFYSCHRDSHDLLGFKEVAYGQWEVELLRRCYPLADLLLLIRNPLNTWNSTPRDWFPDVAAWAKQWTERASWFQQLAAADQHCHLVRYEDIVARKPEVIDLLQHVAKVTPDQIEMVLGNKIGSRSLGIGDDERRIIVDECGVQMEALGYSR